MNKENEDGILFQTFFSFYPFLCLMDLNPFYFSVVGVGVDIHGFIGFNICRRSLETASKTHESIAKRLNCF